MYGILLAAGSINFMEKTQYGTIRIGQIVKLFTDSIGLDALLESVSEKEKASVKKMIQRLEKEEDVRIDTLQRFENLLKEFCDWALENNFMNSHHKYIIQSLYNDMLSLITNTNPYDNPTQKEVELQVMYCIALTYREIYDYFEKTEGKDWGFTLQLTLGISDFWKHSNYEQNIKLIPSCFDFILSDIENSKSELFKYWEDFKDKQEVYEKKAKTDFAKSVNDWIEKDVAPSWKIIKSILASPTPENIQFKKSKSNYYIFKMNLFLAYFFSNFFKSLEEQKLASTQFKEIVQNGLRWFYRYTFIIRDFRQYEIQQVQNPMFSLMRFLVLPTNKSKNLISEYIVEAFDKEIGLTPVDMNECHSLYYIPIEKIYFPILDKNEMQRELQSFQIIYETFMELSTWKDYGRFDNKIINEEEIDFVFSYPFLGESKNFFHNWFKGKYHVLCHEFDIGLNYYRKSFEHRYFGGKNLSQYISEFIALLHKCNSKKTELNHIYEWANALRFCIKQTDKNNNSNHSIETDFEKVFPKEAFIHQS